MLIQMQSKSLHCDVELYLPALQLRLWQIDMIHTAGKFKAARNFSCRTRQGLRREYELRGDE